MTILRQVGELENSDCDSNQLLKCSQPCCFQQTIFHGVISLSRRLCPAFSFLYNRQFPRNSYSPQFPFVIEKVHIKSLHIQVIQALSNELIRKNGHRKEFKADVSSVSPSLGRLEELWVVCVPMQEMEPCYQWEYGDEKTRLNQLNENHSLIPWRVRVPI